MTMRTVYGILTALFLVLSPMGIAVPGYAQDQSSGDEHQPPSPEDIVAKMQDKLSLTQDQVNAVTPIIEKYSSKRDDLRQSMQDGTADRDSIRSQMKELKTDESQELSQVLSADQMSQWEQMMSKGGHKHSGMGGGGNGEGGGDGGGEGSGGGASGSGE